MIKTNQLFLSILLSVSCLISACTTQSSDKLSIVTTTGMINDIVKNIGKEHIQTQALMGAGVDPHLYKASEGDVRRLAKAKIIFYNGLHLEAKMAEVLEKMSAKTTTVAVSKDIPDTQLHSPPEFAGFHDPHIWFDVQLWKQAAQTILITLQNTDPENKETYQKNAEAYLKQLDDLHQYVHQQAQSLPAPKRVLITAHDAFGYFGSAYGFKVMGLQGISTASEAGTKDVQELANYIVQNKIPAIFVESSVPERNIKAVQDAVKAQGWSVKIGGELFSDAMGDPNTPEGTYIGMVQHNINTIVTALKGQK